MRARRVVTILHLADLHFGAEDVVALEGALRYAQQTRPDAVAVSGDLSQYGRRSELEACARWLASWPAPVLVAPSNHDTPHLDLMRRAFKPFGRYERIFSTVRTESLRLPGASLVSMNTARGLQARLNWALGHVSRRDARRAVTFLEQEPPQTVRIVVCHHPLRFPAGSPLKGRTRGGASAAQLFASRGVDLVLTGHLHAPFAQALPDSDGCTYSIGAGTLSERRRGAPASFMRLTLGPSEVEVETLFLDERGQAHHASRQTLPLRARGNETGNLTLASHHTTAAPRA